MNEAYDWLHYYIVGFQIKLFKIYAIWRHFFVTQTDFVEHPIYPNTNFDEEIIEIILK